MSSENTSTLQSYVDSASGAVQSALGSITGNPADKDLAQKKHDEAAAKHDLSHAAAKVGPYTATPEGEVAKDDPKRSQGSWNQTIGSGKETVGNLIGSESLKKQGADQNQEGKAQEAQGQLSDLGKGVADRVQGTVGGAAAGLVGDHSKRAEFEKQHDLGKTQQRGAEVDIQKQNP